VTKSRKARECKIKFDLIVSIVNRGHSQLVVEASKKAGAEGGTILGGRGSGVHEKSRLFGVTIEPGKDIILTLVPRDDADAVLDAILDEAELNKPGKGISFILEVKKVAGITHLLDEDTREKIDNGL